MTDPLRSSDVEPHGTTGLANQGSQSTVEEVGVAYAEVTSASQQAAMDKRDADWQALTGGHAG